MKLNLVPSKTYANEANLDKAITDAGLLNFRYMVAWTQEGRCYAIFIGNDALDALFAGFMVVS